MKLICTRFILCMHFKSSSINGIWKRRWYKYCYMYNHEFCTVHSLQKIFFHSTLQTKIIEENASPPGLDNFHPLSDVLFILLKIVFLFKIVFLCVRFDIFSFFGRLLSHFQTKMWSKLLSWVHCLSFTTIPQVVGFIFFRRNFFNDSYLQKSITQSGALTDHRSSWFINVNLHKQYIFIMKTV